MGRAQTAVQLIPTVLAWVIEWGVVPFTMLWLYLRWMLWGPVLEKPEDELTLDQRRAIREATAGGTALAVVAFLIIYTGVGQRPTPPALPSPFDASAGRLLNGFFDALLFLLGTSAGLFPRPYRHWMKTNPKWSWVSSLALVVWLSSGAALFSLLAYFTWREAHEAMLAGFLGLATGYMLAPLFTRCLHYFHKYPY